MFPINNWISNLSLTYLSFNSLLLVTVKFGLRYTVKLGSNPNC